MFRKVQINDWVSGKMSTIFDEWKLEHTKSGKIKEEYIGKVDVKEEN